VVAVVLVIKWKEASDHGGQKPAEPFRIAGNFYYVGANDVTAFLLTGPEGHVLIDGGYPGSSDTRRRALTTGSRTARPSASDRLSSPRMSLPDTRPAARHGRSPSEMAIASCVSCTPAA
jgi:hypothetical protein